VQHDNQPANERQPGGEVDERQWHVTRLRWPIKRMRGGSGATTASETPVWMVLTLIAFIYTF
jgi:hypothetical protein